jgi:hypothetical protein
MLRVTADRVLPVGSPSALTPEADKVHRTLEAIRGVVGRLRRATPIDHVDAKGSRGARRGERGGVIGVIAARLPRGAAPWARRAREAFAAARRPRRQAAPKAPRGGDDEGERAASAIEEMRAALYEAVAIVEDLQPERRCELGFDAWLEAARGVLA